MLTCWSLSLKHEHAEGSLKSFTMLELLKAALIVIEFATG